MTEGRGITDEGWINGSVKYNEYFRTHEKISEVPFSALEIKQIPQGKRPQSPSMAGRKKVSNPKCTTSG